MILLLLSVSPVDMTFPTCIISLLLFIEGLFHCSGGLYSKQSVTNCTVEKLVLSGTVVQFYFQKPISCFKVLTVTFPHLFFCDYETILVYGWSSIRRLKWNLIHVSKSVLLKVIPIFKLLKYYKIKLLLLLLLLLALSVIIRPITELVCQIIFEPPKMGGLCFEMPVIHKKLKELYQSEC